MTTTCNAGHLMSPIKGQECPPLAGNGGHSQPEWGTPECPTEEPGGTNKEEEPVEEPTQLSTYRRVSRCLWKTSTPSIRIRQQQLARLDRERTRYPDPAPYAAAVRAAIRPTTRPGQTDQETAE